MALPVNPIIILGGQSNMQGHDPVANSPNMQAGSLAEIASVRFCASDNFGQHSAPGTMQMVPWGNVGNNYHHGPEQQLCTDLIAAGWTNITVLKWTHNGTPITDFMAGGIDHRRLQHVITTGRPPRKPSHIFFAWMQGEFEAKSAQGSEALANGWGANYNTLFSQVQAQVGQTLAGGKIVCRLHNRLHHNNPSGEIPWLANLRAQQELVADNLVSTDDLLDAGSNWGLATQDQLHYTSAGQHVFGSRLATTLLGIVG